MKKFSTSLLLFLVSLNAFATIKGAPFLPESDARFDAIERGASIASPTFTGTIAGASETLSGTLAVTGVATLTAAPVLSALTASQAVFTNGSKALTSNAITGSGNVVMSASPTLTGTIGAASATFSGTVGVTGVTSATGGLTIGQLLLGAAAPTFTSGGCSSPSIVASNGPGAFTVNVGSGCSGSQPLVIGLPTATTGWNCLVMKRGTASGASHAVQSSTSTNSVTLTNVTDTSTTAVAWISSEILGISCFGY